MQCEYRDLFEITFRNENPRAAERAQKTWRARVKSKEETHGAKHDELAPFDDSSSSSSSSCSSSTPRSISPVLTVDVMDCAVNRFFYDYVLPSERTYPGAQLTGIFDYIPPLFYHAPQKSSLKQAVYAVSLANFDRRTGCSLKGLRQDIDKHYGNTLRLVAEESKNPKTAGTDELLLAVQMLGIFEQMSTGGNNAIFLQAHAMGMSALIKQRGLRIVTDEYQWRIFRSIQGHLLSACLRLGVTSFIPYSDLKAVYDNDKYPMARILGHIHHGVDLLAIWKAAVAANDEFEKTRLLTQLTTLDTSLADWEQNVPQPAQYAVHPKPDSQTLPRWARHLAEHPGMPNKVHEYDTVQVIYFWTLYRTTRILVSKILLFAALHNPIPGYSVASRQSVILRMAEDACSSVLPILVQPIDSKPNPETLTDVVGFRAMMCILPLTVARDTLKMAPPTEELAQRLQWIDRVLDFAMGNFHSSRWVC